MGARKQDQPRLAKLSLPQLHKPVRRERLFTLLDSRKQHPVLWVGGPAGAGKTTLVASYLETRKVNALWFQVDEGDRDPATFFHYLNELAQQTQAPLALPSFSASSELVAFARHWFREWFRHVDRDSVLVFDNCQDAASASFHQVLRVACEQLPAHINIVALSRSLPPSELARLSAHATLKQIVWGDLRLTADEAVAIGAALGENDPVKVQDSYRLSDGWAIGLTLSLSYARNPLNPYTARFNTREALFDYLLSEMLSRVSGDARKVLTHAALLPQISVPLAQQISGSDHAGDILESLYRNQYLIDRKVDTELTYQFHDLFREFLLEELRRSLAAPELAALRGRAAGLLESAGYVNEAATLLRQAADWGNVARLIKQHAGQLLDQGRWQTLNEWYDGMPPALLDEDGWLIQWLGRAQLIPDPRRGRSLLEQACRQFESTQDDVGFLLAVRAIVDVHFLLGESLGAFRQWLPPTEAKLGRSRALDQQTGIDAWGTYCDLTLYSGGQGDMLAEARDYLLQALRNPEATLADKVNATTVLCSLIWCQADRQSAEEVAPALEECSAGSRLNPIYRHWAYTWSGHIHGLFGRYHEAVSSYEQALALAAESGFAADSSIYCNLVMCYECVAETDQAAHTLRRAQQVCRPERSLQWHLFNTALAYRAYCKGDIAHASDLHQTSLSAARDSGSVIATNVAIATQAAYCVQAGQWQAARELTDELAPMVSEKPYRFLDAVFHLSLAEIALHDARHVDAVRHLGTGLQHAGNPIKAALLATMTRRLPQLLAIALQNQIEAAVVGELIKRWSLVPDATIPDRWPWPVKLYALGEFRVLLNDVPLPAKGRPHFRVLTLLKAIVAAGGHLVSARTLAEWLWPDAEGDVAASNLKVAVHRLRKLLGSEEAVTFREGKVSLNNRLCWLDLWSFDPSSVTRARGSGDAETQSLAESRLQLYRGHLLEDEDALWAIAPRQRLRAKFQRDVIALGQDYEKNGDSPRAIQLYQYCVQIDPAAEAVVCRLMLCLEGLGRRAEAIEVFQRCQRTANTKPTRETLQTYERITRCE